MCEINLCFIPAGDKELIICREKDFTWKKIKKIVKKHLPDILPSKWKLCCGIWKGTFSFDDFSLRRETCEKMIFSQFDCAINQARKKITGMSFLF